LPYYQLESINDHYCDDIYEAAVQSVEEAIVNAMIVTESVPSIKPAGYTLTAIDHEQLKDIMHKFNRL
jgi:L-aminopeptidase/D-esterase-like protein